MATKRGSIKRKALIFEIYFYILAFLFTIALAMLYYITSHPPTSDHHVRIINVFSKEIGTFKIPTSEIIGYSYLKIPAVMNNSKPVYVIAKMFITPGSGNIFINIKDTLLGEDTQHSIRKAIRYALQHEKIPQNIYDFYVNIESDASVLIGPSAGGSFGVLSIAALRNKMPRQDVMMTGTLSKDGRIGLSGKIYEKALASKISGAKIFLVPKGLSKIEKVDVQEECDYYGGKRYCEVIEYINIKDLANETGMEVHEIETLDDALKYFGIE